MKRGVVLTKKNKSNILASVVKTILVLFVVFLVYNFFLLAYTARTEKEAKYIMGYRAYVIITDSMKPNLNTGDIILIKKTENEKLDIGDIVTYKVSEGAERITHRIVEKSEDIYITKGDNNKLEDKNIVRYENIEGRFIFKIPIIGKVFLSTINLFYLLFLSIILLTIYLYNRRTFSKSEIRRQKKEYADFLRSEKLKKEKEVKKKELENQNHEDKLTDGNFQNTDDSESTNKTEESRDSE